MDLNKIELIGRLTAGPDIWAPDDTVKRVSLRLVTSRAKAGARGSFDTDTELHTVIMFGKLAEVAAKYLKKGDRVYIQGRLQTVNHVTKSGTRRKAIEIVAENLILLGGMREVRE